MGPVRVGSDRWGRSGLGVTGRVGPGWVCQVGLVGVGRVRWGRSGQGVTGGSGPGGEW